MHPLSRRPSIGALSLLRSGSRGRSGSGAIVALMLAAAAVGAQSPDPSGTAAAPMPVRVVQGSCDRPGDIVKALSNGIAPAPMPDVGSTVHVSITQVPDAIEDLAGGERVVLVGGVDAESAVACGLSPAVRDDGTSVGVLTAQHDSGHAGAIIIRPVEGGTLIEVVIVSPASPGVEPSGSPGTVTPGSPAPSGAGLSPVRSPLPGTSGAPPFSPIPGAASEP